MKTNEIELNNIVTEQNIRTRFDKSEVNELMRDIEQHGLLHPVGVWKDNGVYKVAYGNRRLEAVRKLGWKKIDVIILDKLTTDEFLAINASENIHRKEITPAELGRICSLLLDKGLNVKEIAIRLSVPASRVENSLRLYKQLPEQYRHLIGFKDTVNSKSSGKVSSQVVNTLLRASRSMGKHKIDLDKLIQLSYKESLSNLQIRQIILLIKSGFSTDEAIKRRHEFITKHISLVIDKEVYNENVIKLKQFNHYVKNLLNGKEKSIENLIYEGVDNDRT